MAEADAFLQVNLAHPDDDAPRLMYADWLEEYGNAESPARAELIRVQAATRRPGVSGKQPNGLSSVRDLPASLPRAISATVSSPGPFDPPGRAR